MSGFVVAYWIVWMGVIGYLVRLSVEQRRLSRSLEALRLQIEAGQDFERPSVRAA